MSELRQEWVTDPDDPLVHELAERQFHWRLRHRHVDQAWAYGEALALVRSLLPDSRLVRTSVGFLWLGPDREQTPVFDVCAADLAEIGRLRDLAESWAGSPLATSRWPGEPSREAFVADDRFWLSATTMRLDVTARLSGEGLADLVDPAPMTAPELAAYQDGAIASYAAERVAAGESQTLAMKTSVASFDEMMPGGRPGPGQHLFTLRHDGDQVGRLWVCERWPNQAWVYDVEIDPPHRGRGFGAAAMVHAGLWTRARGAAWLGLNVFGPNAHARGLYSRLGYVIEEEHFVHRTP